MEYSWLLIGICIALLVLFDFTNGFHDTANMVASLVASRAMTPVQAILLVSLFTFLGPLLGGTAVANTVGGFVMLETLPPATAIVVLFSGAMGAILLNMITWWRGLPSSSSHALFGGLGGAVLVSAGGSHIVWGWQELIEHGHWTGFTKIVATLLFSPLLGFVTGWVLHRVMRVVLRRAHPDISRSLQKLQWPGAAWLAFSHGANDAQKTMAVITLVLVVAGALPHFDVPLWVILLCASAITLGTVSGGWRIIRTVGFGIYRLRPLHAFDSQLASATVISLAAAVGGPVSTTHVVSSTIMGIGAAERPRAVRWGKATEILFTWLVTLPLAALLASITYLIVSRFIL
ncbi:MAG: inorganic phosphate transporter [Acidiferrobacterales bacterium]|jgi:PiT family inorganic phosphate transporter|nr:inorganic phosphate transporter [Acidiferrobacterales bacterium]